MNVLILTPDAVGSTLLQRVLTIYMQFHEFSRPVINLHELTNGLIKYHSPVFNQHVLGKPERGAWGYFQSLQEIVDLLSSVDHYKTSRLAQYHLVNRLERPADLMPFYQYLNDNFFIIACRRENVLEQALSWSLTKITNKLNVYTAAEKINSFAKYYCDPIIIDTTVFLQNLETYKKYLDWSETHFNVASYFYYEQHVPNIEQYILGLPIFASQPKRVSWQDQYQQTFSDWNKCHYLNSDIGSLPYKQQDLIENAITSEQDFVRRYQSFENPTWPKINNLNDFRNLPKHIQNEYTHLYHLTTNTINLLPASHQEFLGPRMKNYQNTVKQIQTLVENKVLVTPPPIKKQTLLEKIYLIKNIQDCLDIYNNWVEKNPTVAQPLSIDMLESVAHTEIEHWKSKKLSTALTPPITD